MQTAELPQRQTQVPRVKDSALRQPSKNVNQWLQNLETETKVLPQHTGTNTASHTNPKSAAETNTPHSSSMESFSGISDSLWFASEGEASFVAGNDTLPSYTEVETPEVSDLLKRVAKDLVAAYFHAATPTDAGENSSKSSSGNSTSSQIGGNVPSSITASSGSNTRSRYKRIPNDNGDEESDRQKRPRVSANLPSDVTSKLLACPYTKFDPQRYSEQNVAEKKYRGCSSCYIRDVPRLKQHLYRVHRRPEHHCPSCFSSFDSRAPLDAHIVERSCVMVSSPFDDKMTPDQVTAIKRREMGRDRIEAWFDIFKILFPDTPPPMDPYLDSIQCQVDPDFREFFLREAPPILAANIGSQVLGYALLPQEEQSWLESVLEVTVPRLWQEVEERYKRRPAPDPDVGRSIRIPTL